MRANYRMVAVMVLSALVGSGCLDLLFTPGGGGSVHHPPPHLLEGESASLELELSTWGKGFGAIDRRYTDVQCLFRRRGQSEAQRVPMSLVRSEKKRAVYLCRLPPLTVEEGPIEYSFEMLFDGHQNQRDWVTVPVVRADPAAGN